MANGPLSAKPGCVRFPQSQGASARCIKQPDNEKPAGEWNTVELIALLCDAIHIVNGKAGMRGEVESRGYGYRRAGS